MQRGEGQKKEDEQKKEKVRSVWWTVRNGGGGRDGGGGCDGRKRDKAKQSVYSQGGESITRLERALSRPFLTSLARKPRQTMKLELASRKTLGIAGKLSRLSLKQRHTRRIRANQAVHQP